MGDEDTVVGFVVEGVDADDTTCKALACASCRFKVCNLAEAIDKGTAVVLDEETMGTTIPIPPLLFDPIYVILPAFFS